MHWCLPNPARNLAAAGVGRIWENGRILDLLELISGATLPGTLLRQIYTNNKTYGGNNVIKRKNKQNCK